MLRFTWLFWSAACGVACARTGLYEPLDDGEVSGGAGLTGGTTPTGGSGAAGSGNRAGLGGVSGSAGTSGAPTSGGGAGASGAGTGGAAGSIAGSGGAAGSDDVLGCDDVPIPPPTTPCERFVNGGETGVESASVSLVPVRSDGRCVSVVTARVEGGVQELAALTFMPWQHWPTSNPLGPLTKIPLPATPSPRFTAAPSDEGRIALAWQKPDGVLAYGWDIEPTTFAGTYLNVMGAVSAFAPSTSTIGYLLTVSDTTSSYRLWARPPSSGYTNHAGTCADGGVAADAERFGDGFLIAASTGSANIQSNGCPNYPDLGGLPTRLAVTHLSAICCSTPTAQWDAGGVVTRVRTAPHPKGIWIVWRTDDGVTPSLRRARIELDGPDPAPIAYEAIGEPWAVPGVFDAVIFGSRLAVVWADSYAGVHQLRVTMIGNDGVVEDFTPQLAIPADLDDMSVVAGPEGTGLLVGFKNGLLKRLSCRPGF